MSSWSWPKFAKRVRTNQKSLLTHLSDYQKPVLIAGCQRSGGTMLASVFSKHRDIADPFWSKDAELDAALLLAGTESNQLPVKEQRFCFQTTYLNERYVEYFEHVGNFRLIWLIRNPHSVVYSMIHNWSRFALNEVFLACGFELAPDTLKKRYSRFGILAIRPIERACYAYLGKMDQCQTLLDQLPEDSIVTVDYNDLVTAPHKMLPRLLEFAELSPSPDFGAEISTSSLSKASRLSQTEQKSVDELCLGAYRNAQKNWIKLRAE